MTMGNQEVCKDATEDHRNAHLSSCWCLTPEGSLSKSRPGRNPRYVTITNRGQGFRVSQMVVRKLPFQGVLGRLITPYNRRRGVTLSASPSTPTSQPPAHPWLWRQRKCVPVEITLSNLAPGDRNKCVWSAGQRAWIGRNVSWQPLIAAIIQGGPLFDLSGNFCSRSAAKGFLVLSRC